MCVNRITSGDENDSCVTSICQEYLHAFNKEQKHASSDCLNVKYLSWIEGMLLIIICQSKFPGQRALVPYEKFIVSQRHLQRACQPLDFRFLDTHFPNSNAFLCSLSKISSLRYILSKHSYFVPFQSHYETKKISKSIADIHRLQFFLVHRRLSRPEL